MSRHERRRQFWPLYPAVRDPGDYEGKHRQVTITDVLARGGLKYADSEEPA